MANPKNTGRTNYDDGYSDYDLAPSSKTSVSSSRKPVRTAPKKKHPFLRFLFSLFSIIILLFLIYIILILSRIHYITQNLDLDSPELYSENNIKNIMIFGEDNHKEGEYGRSDSMILFSIDNKNHELKQTSFMRDLYLPIPDYGYEKLNASYSLGGPELAIKTIEYNFNIKIDDYIIIDFSSFTEIIDAFGGIDLELTAEEIDYINWQCWKNHQVETRNELNIDSYLFSQDEQSTALVHLNGRQALWYARDRDSAGSDFDRTQRQRIVIDTMLTKVKSGNIFGLINAGYAVSPYITTNMQPFSLISSALELAKALNYQRKEYQTPSNDNYYDEWTDSGLALGIYNTDLEKERVKEFIFGTEE